MRTHEQNELCLLLEHRDHLRTSGLSDKTIDDSGIHSIDTAEARALGFARGLRGIGIPYPGTEVIVDGQEHRYYRLRVDPDRVRREGQKYENPLKARMQAGLPYYPYVPPTVAALRKRAEVPVFITEGEKKALKLTQEGFPAIGLPGVFMFGDPASKAKAPEKPLHPDLRRWRLRGRTVFVCFDSDRTEKEAVCLAHERLCRKITAEGALVRVVAIPSASDGRKVGADDFLVAHGPGAFQRLVENAGSWTPGTGFLDLIPASLPEGAVSVALSALAPKLRGASRAERDVVVAAACDRYPHLTPGDVLGLLGDARRRLSPTADAPPIQVSDRQLRDIAEEAWAVLIRSEVGQQLFRRGRDLLYIDDDRRAAEVVLAPRMNGLLIRCATWIAATDTGERNARAPQDLVRDMLAFIDLRVRDLETFVNVPVFLSTGELWHQPGYAPSDRLYHFVEPSLGAIGGGVPTRPTRAEVETARALIVDEMLGEFPFVSPAAQAHAVAAFVQPFVRQLICSPTPLLLIDAPSAGTGKGLLGSIIQICATGGTANATTLPREESEVRKKITALLSQAVPVILFDNVAHAIDSESLAAVLTVEEWTDRRLRHTQMLVLPNRALWTATANNAVLSREISRRTIWSRLDAGVERPWTRTGFRHEYLGPWVRQNRTNIVTAILTLVRWWQANGSSPGTRSLGGFESWSAVVGGILAEAGITGFLEDQNERGVLVDPEEADWAALVLVWHEEFDHRLVDATELMQLAARAGLFNLDSSSADDPSARGSFSTRLARRRDRIYQGFRITIEPDKKRRQNRYRLTELGAPLRQEVESADGE